MQKLGLLLSLLLQLFQETDIAEIYFPVFPEIERCMATGISTASSAKEISGFV